VASCSRPSPGVWFLNEGRRPSADAWADPHV
jgi:hypothetical protein